MTTRLRTRLVVSHVAVALVSLAATGLLVAMLAREFIGRRLGVADSPGPGGRGPGGGVGPQIMTAVTEALLIGLLVGVVAAVLLGVVASRRIARSLEDIRDGTSRLAQGDYSAALPSSTITELDELATDIRAMADHLAETEKRRTRLIGEVGHEMRTPLTVIDAQIEAMLDGVMPLDGDSLAPLAGESRRLRRLADDLSSLSRAEEGRLSLRTEKTDLSGLVAQVTDRLAPQLDDAGIALERAVSPAPVEADPDRISQVITNLIGNAIRATPPGGTVTVTCSARDGRAVAEVSDTGEGIAARDLDTIFERFYRVPSRRTVGGDPGSGIGLTISRSLAQQHGGTLTAASAGPGRGATFTLSLPLTD
ncbi:sensor histidine kinase [Corynebacterium guangdongense]|uniref:histidine kinase n=1 Tax=Corynebacterium guangdongense TaxID=1783348 RepID=A0ABU2A1G7_9CORY|nr:HAMP domain-containing sensor histidine kinase [Corynebacterium guangdongense]MDR7330448.1 histidine kinase [Corynebacterium guangdongense]WJZ19006.1 Sensor protein SrrB [Corynebacterium guangdongense]